MKRRLVTFAIAGLAGLAATAANCSPFTPLEWQQRVEQHSNPALVGQRKHTTWMRDQNRNFIDDEIERRFKAGQRVDVIVNLNECISGPTIAALRQFGDFRYASRLVTFAMLNQVRFEDLPYLAALPEVAMVEWQAPLHLTVDVSTRAIQVRQSATYSPNTAADRPASFNEPTIAIVDSGVDDGVHEALPRSKFVAGFDATRYTDSNHNGIDDSCEPAPLGNVCTDPDDEPGDGTTNPDDDLDHGTGVAHIALGVGTSGRQCSKEQGSSDVGTCAGIAQRAKFVDIKVSSAAGNRPEDAAKGIDWLGINASKYGIKVANLSVMKCVDDDGTSAEAQLVNYVVALGVVFVVGHGNANACPGLTPGTVYTQPYAAASYSIAVGGTDDGDTVSRSDDGRYGQYLQGPRGDFNLATPDLRALKPDITAPAQNIFNARANSASGYGDDSGTSLAAPHVAGAASLVLGTRSLDPGSLKDLLMRTADTSLNNAAYPMVDAAWDPSFGSGMLNVWSALAAATGDVGFPSCIGSPSPPGQPCELAPPRPNWLNESDISTENPPKAGVPNRIRARVRNFGLDPATVLVDFGVYIFAAGNNQFFHIGTKRVTIAPGATETVEMPWKPDDPNHQCIQVSLAFGQDSNVRNNVTQRNLEIAPSSSPSFYDVRIENPLMTPARMDITTTSTTPGWMCRVDQSGFTLDPFFDCARNVRVRFDPASNAKPGESADCHVALSATPSGSTATRSVGGVTVRTFVPNFCTVVGTIQKKDRTPLVSARLVFVRLQNDQSKERKSLTAATNRDGIFSIALQPGSTYSIQISGDSVKPLIVKPECGVGTLRLARDERGLYELKAR